MTAISVENIGKRYGETNVLSNVSFQIEKGETVGIIGPNGAGKSTLLKILSGVVRPSSGRAELNGKVASILEVGTGFHPELSGRDNVFIAGQIMGHDRKTVQERYDEIVRFSELGAHMDKLVKFYSSGMYLRLAFSVFALLDAEILLLDEVLSVGDASFRRKSFELMNQYRNDERTVLLVSHNLNEIENFCDRVIYVDSEVRLDTKNIREAILRYMKDHPTEPKVIDPTWLMHETDDGLSKEQQLKQALKSISNEHFELLELRLYGSNGEGKNVFSYDDQIHISLKYRRLTNVGRVAFMWKLFDMNETQLFATSPLFSPEFTLDFDDDECLCSETVTIPAQFLNMGKYFLTLVPTFNITILKAYHRVIDFEVYHSDWMSSEPWSAMPTPIIHKFDWRKSKE